MGDRLKGPELSSPVMAAAALVYLAVLPLGYLIAIPVADTAVTLSDAFLVLLLLAGLADAGQGGLPWYGARFQIAVVLFLLFALWVGSSGAWGLYPDYAVARGVGYGALALGAYCIASSGLPWHRAAGAWLVGTTLTLALVLTGLGEPLPEAAVLGGYLVVSGILLWSVWDHLAGWHRWAAGALAAAIGAALLLTPSAAWLGAGVVVLAWGRWLAGARPALAWVARLGGAAVVAVSLAGLLFAMRVDLGWMELTTSGVRPEIWRHALGAFLENPIMGAGAVPSAAEALGATGRAAEPAVADPHSLYLSVLVQFGLVGALVLGGAVGFVLGDVLRLPRGRIRAALLVAFLAAGVIGLMVASDARHLWAVVGLAGLACLTVPRGRDASAASTRNEKEMRG